MIEARVQVRELAGWGLDDYEHRPHTLERVKTLDARRHIAERPPFRQSNIVLERETTQLHDAFSPYAVRPDLLDEMKGLVWSLAVIDMRSLVAFQRRICFDPEFLGSVLPVARDWSSLLDFSFGAMKPVECDLIQPTVVNTIILQSTNPNLHFRSTSNTGFPLIVHAGGPFFEVACFCDRWFLRDGYHRAYTLLRAGIFEVPAVVIEAKSIEELGATQPWFFPENVLFSETPPLVTDFLHEDLIIEYKRPPLIKTLRITIEETLTPASHLQEVNS